MIPSINSMMGVGIVFIPGMMTGQILAGADPVQAIRYQIIVMVHAGGINVHRIAAGGLPGAQTVFRPW